MDTSADIAKETADMILLEKDLNTIKNSLIEGRKVYVNIIKYIKTTPQRISDTRSLIITTIVFPFETVTSLQILVFNPVLDISCLAVPRNNIDEYYPNKPRTWGPVSLRRVSIHSDPSAP